MAERYGPEGRPGRAGAEGQPGRVGDSGIDGTQGESGPRGERGIQGERGLQGIQGEKRRYHPTIRDFILVIVSGLVAIALINGRHTLRQIQEGRQFSVGVTCAVDTAITQAGYNVIVLGASAKETLFMRNLEKLGYPPLVVRKVQSRAAAQLYVTEISKAIEKSIGHKGDGLVLANGQLDCARFKVLSARPLIR